MKKVALVLSSGGARGFAHIGAIEELEKKEYIISSIAGSSMGALIGGMYAAGKLQEVKEKAFLLKWRNIVSLVDVSFSKNHFVKGDKIMETLREIIPDTNIEDLPIPFCAIASDIQNNQEVVFDKGSLYEAIRASISIPSFFRPIKSNGGILIDGGVINPLPLNRVWRTEEDLLVAVNVSAYNSQKLEELRLMATSRHKEESLTKSLIKRVLSQNREVDHNHFSLLSKTFSLMIQQNTALSIQLNPPDILVDIPMNRYGGFEYDKAEKISRNGRLKMEEAIIEFNKRTTLPNIKE